MNQLDFDRAFPETPDCIATAIELGIRKGKKKMKFRNKLIAMGSIAAAFAVAIAAALAVGMERPPQPDVLAQPPLKIAEPETMMVYSTEGAGYYHLEENCSGLENAIPMTEAEAVQMGKTPCPACIPLSCSGHDGEEIEFVYYSQGSKYFHRQEECSGTMPMQGEYFAVTKAFLAKEPCPECFPDGIEECVHGRAFVVKPMPSPTAAPVPQEETEISNLPEAEEYAAALKKENVESDSDIVYTEYGANLASYHQLKHCAGREFLREISVMQANRENLQPCEACYFGYVCYTENGTYYHSDAHCQGMQNARQHSREDARRDGKFPCPLCLNVYCTKGGTYYHLLPDCIGMQGAKLRTLEEAYVLMKNHCPVCLSPERVYCTPKGNYFHAVQDCSGMEGAQPTDPESAWNDGKTACPVCIRGKGWDRIISANAQAASQETAALLPQYHNLFENAFGKSINDLIPGYHFDHAAVYQDPELGNGRVWKLKSDTDPDEEAIPGCWLFEKDGMYDAYRLLVNLSTSTKGNGRSNADAFIDGATCTIYGKSYPLDDLREYADIYSYVAKQTGAEDVEAKLELECVMVQFGTDDAVSSYSALWAFDEKEYYTVRGGYTPDGEIVSEMIAGNALV